MANYFNFSSDKVNIIFFLMDISGSMSGNEDDVRRGLEMYQESFKDFSEANSISVCVSQFDQNYYAGEFENVSAFNTYYRTHDGATALYYSIVIGARQLQEYVKEVIERTNTVPTVTFVLFSDGEPCRDRGTRGSAMRAIHELNNAGVTTVFVAFGDAISSEFGDRMGFMSTIDVEKGEALTEFLGEELSKSCKEQSMSLTALGENFFSQATNNSSSAQYSKTTAQALEDESWIDEI